MCLNNIGSIYLEKAQYEDAQTYFEQALQLREKANNSSEIVESVHNLAETQVRLGQYEQAVKQYLRALELRRSANDTRGAAQESYSLGAILDFQGRYGAALSSKQDALKIFRGLKDRTSWMAEILGGYGDSLALAGRGNEAKNYFDEALSISYEIKNDAMVAQTLRWAGDAFNYQGDAKSARRLYEQALQTAARTTDRSAIVIAKIKLANATIHEGGAATAVSTLRSLEGQARQLGLKYVSVECSIDMAEAMIEGRDFARARLELERALNESNKLGSNPLTLRAYYLLATVLRLSGDSSGSQERYRQVLQLLDLIRKGPGMEKAMQRSDLSAISTDSNRRLQSRKN